MNISSIRKIVLAGLFAASCLVVLTLISHPSQPVSGNGVLALQAPSFINVARAEGAAPTAVSAIVDEAGISAYVQAPVSITISSVASLFRTIEFSNTDYIIGSIAVPNYDITYDVHVYIHRDGWVLVYYMKTDPASKVFDWRSYNGTTIDTTVLRNVLLVVADGAGFSLPSVTYYDFRSPNATNLMLVAKKTSGDESFQVTLPGSFVYYERSWSFASRVACYGSGGSLYLDGVVLKSHGQTGDFVFSYGGLSLAQLLPDILHTFRVTIACDTALGGLALVYRVP